MTASVHVQYLLRLADNALILSQRLSEWCGHGPILEEDLSLTNMALDLLGQARLLYSHAGQLEGSPPGGRARTEDDYAYWRDEAEFRNWTLCELPNAAPGCGTVKQDLDYALTVVRNVLYSALMVEVWSALSASVDAELAAIAAKSLKEARYHLRHAAMWVVRFGDGTAESHARAQAALDHLLPYCNEIFAADAVEDAAAHARIGVRMADLEPAWREQIAAVMEEATLALPHGPAPFGPFASRGKLGTHSEHMGFLLAEMQSLARQHPGATW